jgi:ferredoxin
MPYKIIADECTNCAACESECPNDAISEKKSQFTINAGLCTECIGFYDDPQCVEVCPIPDCIVIDDRLPRHVAA